MAIEAKSVSFLPFLLPNPWEVGRVPAAAEWRIGHNRFSILVKQVMGGHTIILCE